MKEEMLCVFYATAMAHGQDGLIFFSRTGRDLVSCIPYVYEVSGLSFSKVVVILYRGFVLFQKPFEGIVLFL